MKPKVLIVEDELITAMEFKEALVDAEFEVPVIADRVSKAKEAFESISFDLILLDITLKHDQSNGLDFAEYVRKSSSTPIMFITGDTNETMLERMNSLGNCNYMMKAVRTPELVFKSKLMIGNKDSLTSEGVKYQEVVLLPINRSHQKVKKSDIVAIKGNGSYSDIYIANEAHYHTLSMNMKKLLEGLDYPDFFRLNRSNIVNLNFVEKIEKDQLYLSSHDLKYTLAKGVKKEILELLPNVRT
ncbi:LytR/AlgR family response regulator transcription factor [Lacihabitans soyangensis]|uniref:Response regulator n=1 Tax=Lacihabitans soyangensis TaxID=869394 RepID=A0AAE3KWJ3_9BACT|nr:response regulator [Lacihabitans soyangensis]MCP9762955.1 response regulator [Lacihabitans soyangensis]